MMNRLTNLKCTIIMSTKAWEVHAIALIGNSQQEVRTVSASTTKYGMNIQGLK
jgi:hypothetical protein